MAKEFDLKFFEASAKEDINIAPTFEALVKDIYKVNGNSEEGANGKLIGGNGKNGKRNCC